PAGEHPGAVAADRAEVVGLHRADDAGIDAHGVDGAEEREGGGAAGRGEQGDRGAGEAGGGGAALAGFADAERATGGIDGTGGAGRRWRWLSGMRMDRRMTRNCSGPPARRTKPAIPSMAEKEAMHRRPRTSARSPHTRSMPSRRPRSAPGLGSADTRRRHSPIR